MGAVVPVLGALGTTGAATTAAVDVAAATTASAVGTGLAESGYGVYQGQQAKAGARQAASQSRRAQRVVEADLAAQAAQAEAEKQRGLARNTQRQRAFAASGRQSTLLTGPLGIQGEPLGGQRTLLGG